MKLPARVLSIARLSSRMLMSIIVREDRAGEIGRCADCRHREHDRAALERAVPGLAVFGSAFGASVGVSRLCRRHDRLTSPHDHCAAFETDRQA